MKELKQQARDSLDTLKDIAVKIEDALSESDDYWTWATFYKDKKDELLPIKDKGKQAVDQLQESVESLREKSESSYDQFFDEIDEKKARVADVVDELREMGSVKAAVLNGDELADLLRKLLDRFRETSQSVEALLEAMDES
jgi:methyl-accepting chemotaxis protein